MKTSRLLSIIAGIAGTFSLNAQTVGDPSLGTYDFSTNELLYTATTSNYHPKLMVNGTTRQVSWGHGTSGDVGIFGANLDANYSAVGDFDSIVGFTGQQMSDANSLNHAVYRSGSQTVSAYMIADRITVVQNEFSLKAALYSDSDFSSNQIYIEGPFDYTTDAPNRPDVASDGNGQFCVAYHSNSGSSTSSVIRVKMIDFANATVSPAPMANTQTGIAVTSMGAQHPSIAYNSASDVYGIVYRNGAGSNSKIKFVSIDGNGTVVTAEKDVISGTDNVVAWPKLEADGDGFVMVWQDFRPFQIPPNSEISGMPAARITRLTATGDIKTMTGPTDLFDADDNSLILSNPYTDGSYINQQLITITPGEKYAAVWATQDTPSKIQMTEVHVGTDGSIKAMVPVTVNNDGQISDRPSIAYNDNKYIIAYNEYNGTRYENRITTGTFDATGGGTSGLEEQEFNVQIFPNPSEGIFQLSEKVEEIVITDMNGKEVFARNQTKMIDLSNYDSGIYFALLNGQKTIKLIKK